MKILRQVDELCAANGVARVDVICELIRALVEGRTAPLPEQAPEGETRAARAEAAIRKVMRSRRRCSVRDLKAATSSKRISVGDWDKALQALCKAGEMRVADEPGNRGQTRRVVTLTENGVKL
jgi:hypothetical protein